MRDSQETCCGPVHEGAASACLHHAIYARAEARPQAIAVRDAQGLILYQGLAGKARILGEALRAQGVRQGEIVALSMRRSLEAICGLLGILDAGAAYCPIDPEYPRDRVLGILGDIHARVILVDPDKAGTFEGEGPVALCPEAFPSGVDPTGASGPPVPLHPEAPAYVLFTSGSTGRPKGVVCHHKGVLNLLSDIQDLQALGPGDVGSWWTGLGFDVSVYEIFSPLTTGATLTVVPDRIRADPRAFLGWLAREGVTSAYVPPFMVADLAAWVRENPGKSSLRRLLVGVEPIPEGLLRGILHGIPGIAIVNGYGPTETTVCATLYPVPREGPLHENTPIGRPVRNMTVSLLDEGGAPVSPGDPGEVWIGGAGVALGYWNRPDLTAERFQPLPSAGGVGPRAYRTGDWARLLPDGNLAFIGRRDFQVKFHGYRIELGEIETALRTLGGVREAVVLLREDQPGNPRLVAYLTGYEGASWTVGEIKGRLRRTLPAFMIPGAYVRLERMPVTRNGKTDRGALPLPTGENRIPDAGGPSRRPGGPMEETLAALFEDLLGPGAKGTDGAGAVGIEEDFFALGGHSLLGTQLLSRIRDLFGVDLPLAALFQTPTVKGLAHEVEKALGLGGARSGLPALLPSRDPGPPPLSFSQERLWYLDRLEPGTPAYTICVAHRIEGPLDGGALGEAIDALVDRHPCLRTVFRRTEGGAVQVLVPRHTSVLERISLAHIPEAGREAEVRMLSNKEAHQGFDLEKGPLFRGLLIQEAPERHTLVLSVHHAVSDGWSMGILLRELEALYGALRLGAVPYLQEFPVSYGDFARWQKGVLLGGGWDGQLRYWKDRFASLPEALDLPTDRVRPPVQGYRGASVRIFLGEALSEEIRALAKRTGVTLFMTLLAGFKALLHRMTHQEDLCVGTFIANRNLTQTEGIVGFFINSLALRTDLGGDPSFETLIHRVKRTALEAYAHQDLPFEQVLSAVHPPRDLSRTPLFQVMMVLQNMPLSTLSLEGLRCTPLGIETFRANFDLTLWFHERGRDLEAILDYSEDLFENASAARMLTRLKILLEQACQSPQTPLSKLEILSAEERRRALLRSRPARPPRRPFTPVTTRIADMARAQPNRPALLAPGEGPGAPAMEISYGALHARVDCMARSLLRMGLKPGGLVASCLGRGPAAVIGLLGILEARGVYAPLDPGQPEERLLRLLRDMGPFALLADPGDTERLSTLLGPAGPGVVPWDVLEAGPLGPPSRLDPPGEGDPAAVIHTSGSTGRPKGVLLGHLGLAAFVDAASALYRIQASDRLLQFASLGFDASLEEIFLSLTCGATLLFRTEAMLRSVPAFLKACGDLGITVLDLPTAFWHQMVLGLPEGGAGHLSSLRLMIIGGEEARPETVSLWFRKLGTRVRLLNTYGPTEATVVALAADLTEGFTKGTSGGRVPIGRELPHVGSAILDPWGGFVPPGVAGELRLIGASLALGYLGHPERSGEVFCDAPWDPGTKTYRTGDRVRERNDGLLEYLGRGDRQVKIRGFRVEPAEIEAALLTLPGVREAAVVPRQDPEGPTGLVAYVVSSGPHPLDPVALREGLAQRLPQFMVPSAFVTLEGLPLTRSGKIDRGALPPPGPIGKAGPTPPGTPLEQTLVEIWEQVFGKKGIGVEDNFFDLGGHSLLSLEIIDRVNRAGLWLTPAQFVRYPTIRALASVIATARPGKEGGRWSCLVELQPEGDRMPLYFLHSTPGDVLGYMNLIARMGRDRPCYGFQALGLLHPSGADHRIEDMARRYTEELLAFQPKGPYYLAGWCYGGILAMEMALQLDRRFERVGGLFLFETPLPRKDAPLLLHVLGRLEGLLSLGPSGWVLYARNKIGYLRKLRNKEIERLFSLHLDHGPLAHRSAVYRLNWEAVRHYRMSGRLSCAIRLFQGDRLEIGYVPDPENRWVREGRDVERHVVPGNHLTILREPGVGELARVLRSCLDDLERGA